jgi:hypothetical protein
MGILASDDLKVAPRSLTEDVAGLVRSSVVRSIAWICAPSRRGALWEVADMHPALFIGSVAVVFLAVRLRL